jgi:spermidine synthase
MNFCEKKNKGILVASILVAISGIIYELLIGTISSYLLGNSVLQFSLTIGIMLFGMGIGSILSQNYLEIPEEALVVTQSLLAFLGGNAPLILSLLFLSTISFYVFFFIITLIIGVCIGFEIPMLFSLITKHKEIKHTKALSIVLSLDYLGSLIASILFPLLLLPYFGVVATAYIVGFLNIFIALVVCYYFFEDFKRKLHIIISVISIGISLVFGLIFSQSITSLLDKKMFEDEIILTKQTPYQKIVITRFKDDIRMFLDGNIQFSSLDEYRYHETLIHPIMLLSKAQKVLLLGGGDGLAVREVLKYPEITNISIVDLDKEVTQLAKNASFMKKLNKNSLLDKKVSIINQDAFSYLLQNKDFFDAIIVDLPDPNNESLAKLYSKEFYLLLKKRLSKNGLFITQATSPYFSKETFWTINKTIEEANMNTYPMNVDVPSFGRWGFILASHSNITLEIQYLPDIFEKKQKEINLETSFINKQALESVFLFEKDIQKDWQKNKTQINTLYKPTILKSYEKDEKRWE